MDDFWKWATYLLLIFGFVTIMINPGGFKRLIDGTFGLLSGLGNAIITAGKT